MWIQLAASGLLVALLPVLVICISADSNKYRRLAWATLFLTFDLVLFGAFTRLTDSGLGCPDWPGCYGHANPFQAHESISAAQTAMPTGPVTVVKAWIEMIHRYMAMGVGVLIVSIMLIAWRNVWRKQSLSKISSPAFPTVLFFFVCLQGAFGAWTVTLKLQPIIVTTHLLLALTLLGLLTWFCMKQNLADAPPAAGLLRMPAALALILLACQIALGGWVSTNYAALACTDFPLCQGAVIPPMDFDHGFHLWRKLGQTANGDYLPFAALTAIHWVHRNAAFIVFALVAWVAWRALRLPSLNRLGRFILGVLCLQLATGMATVFLKWPLALAVMHNGGAAALVVLLVMLNFRAWHATSAPQREAAFPSFSPAQDNLVRCPIENQ